MTNISKRLDALKQWNEKFKHLRGRHDQRDHNRWPAGYVAQSYVPTGRRGSFMGNRPSGQLGGGIQNVALSSMLLSQQVQRTLDGQALVDRMNDLRSRPTAYEFAKQLLRRGMKVQFKQEDVTSGKITQSEYDALRPFNTPSRWERGENFFKGMQTTPVINPAIIARKSAYWQRAYTAALQLYRARKDVAAQQKAVEYADHVEHLTNADSPFQVSRQFTGLHWLNAVLNPVRSSQLSEGRYDVFTDTLSSLRRVLAVPKSLWEKYKGGSIDIEQPYFDEFFGAQEFTASSYSDTSLFIENAMKRGKESIFGYVADKFPEMQPHLYDLFKLMSNGYAVTRLPDAMAGKTSVPPSVYTLDAPYQNPSSTLPQPINNTDFYTDSQNGMIVPKSSARLMQVIDPNGYATLAQNASRQEMDSSVLDFTMQKVQEISSATGVPTEIVSALMAYWQHGTQTINGYPVPMLVRMQDAAADLFGLQLGAKGQKLNLYQAYLLAEADRITKGGKDGRQWNSTSSDELQRTELEIEHLFWDWFQKDFSDESLEELSYPFLGKPEKGYEKAHLNMTDEQIRKRFPKNAQRLIDERNRATSEQKAQARQGQAEFDERNRLTRERNRLQNSDAIPGTPYENPQQARKAVLKYIYDKTQKMLRDNNIGRTTLYRSISLTMSQIVALQNQIRQATGDSSYSLFDKDGNFDPSALSGRDIRMPRNALESWTADFLVADSISANVDSGFAVDSEGKNTIEPIVAEIVIGADFDPSRIVSTARTGFGQFREGEVVITGNRSDALKVVGASSRVGNLRQISRGRVSSASALQQLLARFKRGNSAYWYQQNATKSRRYSALIREGMIQARAAAIALHRKLGFN